MVHCYSYAEFHTDPLPRAVGDVSDNGAIIKDGLSDPCAGHDRLWATHLDIQLGRDPRL